MFKVLIENCHYKYAYIDSEYGRLNTSPDIKDESYSLKMARLIINLTKMHYGIIPIDFKYVRFVSKCHTALLSTIDVQNIKLKIEYVNEFAQT